MQVYIHGNCQAPALARLISESLPQWNVASYEVFGQNIVNEIDRYRALATTADIVIAQPVMVGYRGREDLSLDWLKASAKPSACFVIFPSMFFDGQLIGCRSLRKPAYCMDYHDALFLHLVMAGVELSTICNILLSDELYSAEFIEQEMALSLNEMRRREYGDNIDIPLSPFLAKYAACGQLFHVINHPCRPALAYTANEILGFLGYRPIIPYAGKEQLPFPHTPCLPSVMRFMQEQGTPPEDWNTQDAERYHLPDGNLTPTEYYARAAQYLATFSSADQFSWLKERSYVESFLSRVAAKVSCCPKLVCGAARKAPNAIFRMATSIHPIPPQKHPNRSLHHPPNLHPPEPPPPPACAAAAAAFGAV